MIIKFSFYTLLLMLIVSCQQSSRELTNEEKTRITEQVKKTLNDYCDDIKKDGFMAELKYLDDSPDFYWAPPGYSGPINYDSVVAIISLNAPRFSHVENKWESLKINVLTSDLASYSGRIQSFMTDTAGIASNVRLIETGIVIRRPNGWKLLSGQTSVIR